MQNHNELTRENNMQNYKQMYEQIKLILVGDSDTWTHEEVVERTRQAIDALKREEDFTI